MADVMEIGTIRLGVGFMGAVYPRGGLRDMAAVPPCPCWSAPPGAARNRYEPRWRAWCRRTYSRPSGLVRRALFASVTYCHFLALWPLVTDSTITRMAPQIG